jgi:hypothetical protein
MLQVNVARLHDDTREALALAWIAGRDGGTTVRREAAVAASLIGHLNLTHPNSIQVIGAYEAGTLAGHVKRLFEAKPAAVIVADGVMPPQALIEEYGADIARFIGDYRLGENVSEEGEGGSFDADVVQRKLQRMEMALDHLAQLVPLTETELRDDPFKAAAVERFVSRIVDLAVATNAHIASTVLQRVPGAVGIHGDDDSDAIAEFGRLDIMNMAYDTMQSALTSYKLAGYPPDVMIEIPKSSARTYEFYRAAELIELGRTQTAQALEDLDLIG